MKTVRKFFLRNWEVIIFVVIIFLMIHVANLIDNNISALVFVLEQEN